MCFSFKLPRTVGVEENLKKRVARFGIGLARTKGFAGATFKETAHYAGIAGITLALYGSLPSCVPDVVYGSSTLLLNEKVVGSSRLQELDSVEAASHRTVTKRRETRMETGYTRGPIS